MNAYTDIVNQQQQKQINTYIALVKTTNAKINLVSRQDISNLFEHHVAPSCLFYILHRIQAKENILDIGSGGGFPGIICAILQPQSNLVLIDSTRKKVEFLKMVVEKLTLKNVTVLWQRVETLAQEAKWQNKFDRTISRAVAPLTKLLIWSRPLLKPLGTVEALKGRQTALTEGKTIAEDVTFYTPPPNWQWNEHLAKAVIVSILPKKI